MGSTMNAFKGIILAQLFFSFAITIMAYATPAGALVYVDSFTGLAEDISLNSTATDIQDSLEQQTNIPVVEVGALIFYSGNILLDLLLNFTFAVPEMIGLILHGIVQLVSIDTYIWAVVQMFATVATLALYLIGLIEMLTSVRSGRVI